jgi:hypothetical protein
VFTPTSLPDIGPPGCGFARIHATSLNLRPRVHRQRRGCVSGDIAEHWPTRL